MSNGATIAAAKGSEKGNGAGESWFSTSDPRRVSLIFLGWISGMFLLGAIFAVNMKLKASTGDAVDPVFYHQTMTYHGVIMVFMFLVPAIPMVLGYGLLPLQLGSRGMALPIFTRFSLRMFMLGSLLMAASLAMGAVDSGWMFRTPYSLTATGALSVLALGLFCMGVAWALTGINFIVTVHEKRAAGMGFFQMPVLSWALYLTGYILVFAGLVFAIVIMYLAAAKASGKGLFAVGTNPLDWQNYFWFVTTPAAFFALLPAAGVISEVIAGISRKAVAGYRTVVGALIALLALSFVTWGVHLVGTGQDEAASFVFAFLSLFAVVPVALLSFSWLNTLYRGSIACAPPTTFTVAFILCGGIGSVLGLFLSSLSVGSYLNNTMFATAHAHYVLLGGVTTAFLAGLFYWWPRLTGRTYNSLQGRVGGVLYMVGLNLAFFPQIIMGTQGAAAGLPAGEGHVGWLQSLSGVGMVVLLVGLVIVAWTLIRSLMDGQSAPANPWGATTLEWQEEVPEQVGDPYQF
jgi:cytochrome c oxidase subunit 1